MGGRKYFLIMGVFLLFSQITYASKLVPYLINPLSDINVTQNEFFNFTAGVKCVDGACGNITATLDPAAIYCTQSPCIASSDLIKSKDNISKNGGPNPVDEPNAPNTIDGCVDGYVGRYLDNAVSIESITISNLGKKYFKIGDNIQINISAHCKSSADLISFIYANKTNNPLGWQRRAYALCPFGGTYNFSRNITLDNIAGNHTIRGLIQPISRGLCGDGIEDDQDDLTILVLGDKGVIPMNEGTPFYTITQNPMYANNLSCLQNMKENNSCNITWTVNATGNIGEEYEFFAIFESDDPTIEKNETNRVNIRIITQPKEDTTPPFIIIHSPQNITYNELNISLNVTANKTIDKWRYNLNDNGNITFIPNITIIAIEGNNYLVVYANDTAGNIGKNNVSFIVELYNKFNISLTQGWNLISFPLNLTNKSIKDVFKDVSFKSVFGYGSWNYYFNETDNNLNTINETNGYWINSLNNQTLTIEGKEFDSINLSLKQGWNLIGYPSLNSTLINETLNNLNYSVVYTYNNSNWLSYIPNRNDSLNTLKYFLPGYGYWVWIR